MRNILTTLLEVAGLIAVTVGATLIYSPLGWIVGGALAVLVSVSSTA